MYAISTSTNYDTNYFAVKTFLMKCYHLQLARNFLLTNHHTKHSYGKWCRSIYGYSSNGCPCYKIHLRCTCAGFCEMSQLYRAWLVWNHHSRRLWWYFLILKSNFVRSTPTIGANMIVLKNLPFWISTPLLQKLYFSMLMKLRVVFCKAAKFHCFRISFHGNITLKLSYKSISHAPFIYFTSVFVNSDDQAPPPPPPWKSNLTGFFFSPDYILPFRLGLGYYIN